MSILFLVEGRKISLSPYFFYICFEELVMPKFMLPDVPLAATSENLAADLRKVGVMVISVSIERESRKAIVEYAEVASRSSSAKK